jgi:hypothetical protein
MAGHSKGGHGLKRAVAPHKKKKKKKKKDEVEVKVAAVTSLLFLMIMWLLETSELHQDYNGK